MRYFRIPGFSGIEGHRNKPDRGTLRVVEGCIPYPAGGLRSGPVWSSMGSLTNTPASSNRISYAQDDEDNLFLLVFYNGMYSIHAFPATYAGSSMDTPKLGDTLSGSPTETVIHTAFTGWATSGFGKMFSSNIGNRRVAIGNGGANPLIADMDENVTDLVEVDTEAEDMYKLAGEEFPRCSMFVRGPRKTLYAAGNPASPLTVYMSEPAGVSEPEKDSMYSSYDLSKIDILLTDATRITGLSVLASYVVVHTDHGVTILYGPNPGQATSGFRVEQLSSPVSSAAINHMVVSGQQNQPFYLARDGQIYKDESTTAGPDGKPMYSDPRQISWKAKGLWSDADMSAEDISTSFAAYDPGIGMYFVYLPTKENE